MIGRLGSLQTRITALALVISGVAGMMGGAILVNRLLSAIQEQQGQLAMAVARTIAQVEDVRSSVGRPDGAAVIQPIAERMRIEARVDYVVVIDMDRVRFSSALPERLGTVFEGGDEGPALAQQAYLSRAAGVRGPSVRAFVPILSPDGLEQVGVAVVGVLEPQPIELLRAVQSDVLLAFAVGLSTALVGAWILARSIRRQMFGLEPREIARLLEERVAIASSIREGLIAIDREGRITLVNDQARQMLGIGEEVLRRPVWEVIPNSRLPVITETGIAEHDQPMRIGAHLLVANRVPIRVGGEIVGAVATFRYRSDVERLAEELTSVQQFVKALRASNHEWLNKLHTIAGLLQLGRYERAKEYIFAETEGQQEAARFIARNFADARISGLLLGKVARARELGVELRIDDESRLTALNGALKGIDVVGIAGNLLENAIEAAASTRDGTKPLVRCRIRGGGHRLTIDVVDNGPGIPDELLPGILAGELSTKGAGRGMGLALVRREVDLVGGRLAVDSRPGSTRFSVVLDEEVSVGRPD